MQDYYIVQKTTELKVVGAFSIDARGNLCFHEETDLEHIVQVLNENVTGGPFKVVLAYAAISSS